MRIRHQRKDSAAVHPHGRGDNPVASKNFDFPSGSPPQAWGQLVETAKSQGSIRFTPTGVGTMPVRRKVCQSLSVHPHGRGDNRDLRVGKTAQGGSPPRAWGQCGVARGGGVCYRFTPTGVGTMTQRARQPTTQSVHPHGRGDNIWLKLMSVLVCGSPPRAWGQLSYACCKSCIYRFTPTGVGTMIP